LRQGSQYGQQFEKICQPPVANESMAERFLNYHPDVSTTSTLGDMFSPI